MVCAPGSILCFGFSQPWTVDATGHEHLLLLRDARIGIDFRASCHPRSVSSVSGCEERIPSHGKLGVLGSGPCDPSIIMAASMSVVHPGKPNHTMRRIQASRLGLWEFGRPWRIAPTSDGARSATLHIWHSRTVTMN